MSELTIVRDLGEVTLEPVVDEFDGWGLFGMAVPYNRATRVTDDGGRTWYRESWAPGVFSRDVSNGGRWVSLFAGHRGDDGLRYIGRCARLVDRSDGLYPLFVVDEAVRGTELGEAARSGELTGWSVQAKVYRTRPASDDDGPVAMREMAGLVHVAATRSPQYSGAGVILARDHEVIVDAPPATPPTPRLDAIRARLADRVS